MAQESGRPYAVLQFWSRVRQRVDTIPVFRAILVGLLFSLGIVFLIVVYSDDPSWALDLLGTKDLERSKYETLKFLGLAMGGILVALQALMSYRRANAMEDRVWTAEQGQQHERLKNAIEHLGHEKDSVRMGGAYELFYLVKDDQDLGDMAVEILCAHIRRLTSEEEYRKTYRSRPSEEVQSLLSLLFMQEHNVFDCYYINLRGAWLNGADFSRARLQDANLDAAQLQGAYLFEADLRGAILDNAQLQMALLPHANLHAASLDATNLQGASLDNTHLQGATLVKAQLQEASLTETDLRGVRSQVLSSDSDKTVRELVDSSGFEEEIRSSIGKETDLSGAILVGGLTQEAIDSFLSNLPKVDSQELSGLLELHIGMTASHELPEDSCAIIGAYSKTDAAKWISEYEDASG